MIVWVTKVTVCRTWGWVGGWGCCGSRSLLSSLVFGTSLFLTRLPRASRSLGFLGGERRVVSGEQTKLWTLQSQSQLVLFSCFCFAEFYVISVSALSCQFSTETNLKHWRVFSKSLVKSLGSKVFRYWIHSIGLINQCFWVDLLNWNIFPPFAVSAVQFSL